MNIITNYMNVLYVSCMQGWFITVCNVCQTSSCDKPFPLLDDIRRSNARRDAKSHVTSTRRCHMDVAKCNANIAYRNDIFQNLNIYKSTSVGGLLEIYV